MISRLLATVKKYPELYDRQHSDYKRLKVSKILWNEVSKEMGLPADHCRLLWTGLKRQYVNAIKLRKYSSTLPDFQYEEQMCFLWPFYEDNLNDDALEDSSDDEESNVLTIHPESTRTECSSRKSNSDYLNEENSIPEQMSNPYSDYYKNPITSGNEPRRGINTTVHHQEEDEERTCEAEQIADSVKEMASRKLTKSLRRDMRDLKGKYRNFNIRGLILLVKEFPPLYDIRRDDYGHYRGRKSEIWESIAEKIGSTVNECGQVWRIVKKLYYDFLDHRNEDGPDSWLYENEMSFMHPIYEKLRNIQSEPMVRISEYPIEKASLPFDDESRIEFDLKVIEAVKNYPALYNTAHIDYHRYRNNRDVFWEKVAFHANATVEDCRRAWINLKKGFLKRLRKEAETKTVVKWRYLNQMSFLRPMYTNRKNGIIALEEEANQNSGDSSSEVNDDRKKLEINVVKAVEKFPILYDIRLPEFVNLRGKKGMLWVRAGKEANCDPNECRKIWNRLLSAYLEYLRRKNSSCSDLTIKWKFEKEMSFLRPIYDGSSDVVQNSNQLQQQLQQQIQQQHQQQSDEAMKDEFKYKLIELVKQRPVLYDVTHPNFPLSRISRQPLWNAIGKKMGCSADKCRETWSELRKYYIRYEKRRLATGRTSEWKFARAMGFFNLFIGESGKIALKVDAKTGELFYRDERKDFERKLIELVKKNPQLYDFRRYDFLATTDIAKRKQLWSEIGKELNVSGQECSQAWRSLKKFYVNSLTRPVPGESPLGRKWKFKEEMKFLLPLYSEENGYKSVLYGEDEDVDPDEDNSNSVDTIGGNASCDERSQDSNLSQSRTKNDIKSEPDEDGREIEDQTETYEIYSTESEENGYDNEEDEDVVNNDEESSNDDEESDDGQEMKRVCQDEDMEDDEDEDQEEEDEDERSSKVIDPIALVQSEYSDGISVTESARGKKQNQVENRNSGQKSRKRPHSSDRSLLRTKAIKLELD